MARTKGSKNKDLQAKIDDIVKDVIELNGDSKETAEAIAEIGDLLDSPSKESTKPNTQSKPVPAKDSPSREKVFLGFHPITKEEVYL